MTVDPRWIRSEVDRVAVAEGCYFDREAGEFACDFIETFCRQSKGRWADEPITLLDWQRDFVMRLFGWKRADGTRRYRRFYLEVAKKNGKSTLVSALVLLLLMADDEGAPEVYLMACDLSQTKAVFDEAVRMVRASPDLAKRLKIQDSKSDKRITEPLGHGSITALSSIAASKDGLNPHGAIFDELHRQPDRRLWSMFEHAGASREQPIIGSITTAGESQEGPWYEQREYSEKVNAGEILDTTHLGVIYRALETDDIDDPATWRKANPSMGATMKEDEFARALVEAKRDPAKLANFKRLRLNIIQREDVKFLAAGVWESCPPIRPIEPGSPCWAGLDLSSIEDLTALVVIFGDTEDGFDLLCKFWLPEDDIVDLERRHKVHYRAWADADYITLTPGNVIDYGFIRRAINDLAGEHDLKKLLVDPCNATMLLTALQDEDGLPVGPIRQGFLSGNAPTKELQRLVLSGRIRHGNNPVLKWMAGNAVGVTDAHDCIKLDKKKSRHKIDGMAALVNAIAAVIGEDAGPSIYETRGRLKV